MKKLMKKSRKYSREPNVLGARYTIKCLDLLPWRLMLQFRVNCRINNKAYHLPVSLNTLDASLISVPELKAITKFVANPFGTFLTFTPDNSKG